MINFARIRDLARQEERLRWAVKRQEAKCTKITPTYSNAPRGGGGEQRREEDMIRLLTVKEQHNAVKEALEDERDNLSRYTRRLKDGTWRAAMEYRYMKAMRITEIGEAMGYSERQVFRILQRAEAQVLQWQTAKDGKAKAKA